MNRDFFNSTPEVVVSGIGLVSPLGSTREATWSNLIAGNTGIICEDEKLVARVFDFSPNGARSRMGDFALLASAEALQHAGFDSQKIVGANIGCAVSQSKPLLNEVLASFTGWSAEALVRREFHLAGPAGNVVAACATGIASIDQGAFWIKTGLCDLALVGASESSLNSFYTAGFEQMGVLAMGQNPNRARPFDRNRSGFVMGEGAVVLVLENSASAKERGHIPLAKLKGVCLQQSAGDSIKLEEDGSSVTRLLKNIMGSDDAPDYINAHGTGTRFNDLIETRGLKKMFGPTTKIPVSSTKAATGHLLGAAGALEAALAVLAIRDQVIPPTLHLENADPECDLDYVPREARLGSFQSTLSLSYGFGGQMGAVLFGRS